MELITKEIKHICKTCGGTGKHACDATREKFREQFKGTKTVFIETTDESGNCITCKGSGIEKVETINVYGTYEAQIKILLGIAVEIYKHKQETVNGSIELAKLMMEQCVKK